MQGAQAQQREQQPRRRAPASAEGVCVYQQLPQRQWHRQRERGGHRQRQHPCRLAPMHLGRQPGGEPGEHQQQVRLQIAIGKTCDLVQAVAGPPGQAPQVEGLGRAGLSVVAQAAGTGKAGQGHQQRTHRGGIEQRPQVGAGMVHEPDRQRATGQQLQRGAGQRRQHPPLAQPQPQQAGAFQREHRRGGPRRQRQWHRQGGKTHRQHRIGIAQHPIAGALPQRPGQAGVERAQAQRAQRQRHARGAGQEAGEQAGLQAEGDQRQAEQQATIDQATPALGLAAREQDRHHQVEQEEQQQERLGAGIVLGAIAVGAPQRADAEGEEEAEQVEDAPRTEPGDRHDRRVEQRVVRKQRHVVAAAGGQPQRGQEAGQQREYRQRPGVLQYRQQAHTGHQHHTQAERGPGR